MQTDWVYPKGFDLNAKTPQGLELAIDISPPLLGEYA
jgi:hypothetical protein